MELIQVDKDPEGKRAFGNVRIRKTRRPGRWMEILKQLREFLAESDVETVTKILA
jgi:hypothetical protein